MAKNQPKTLRIGNIKINKWESEKFPNTFNYTIAKSYKDDSGEWKDTSNFSASDLCAVYTLLGQVIKTLATASSPSTSANKEADNSESNTENIDSDIPF